MISPTKAVSDPVAGRQVRDAPQRVAPAPYSQHSTHLFLGKFEMSGEPAGSPVKALRGWCGMQSWDACYLRCSTLRWHRVTSIILMARTSPRLRGLRRASVCGRARQLGHPLRRSRSPQHTSGGQDRSAD
jgi:hypothetical protein